MNFPSELKYTAEHEWIRVEGNTATIGITDHAQHELGDIVFVDINTVGKEVEQNEIFGSVEAVKTVSDLFLPVKGKVLEVNPALNSSPELINSDPYGEGWVIKLEISDAAQVDALMDSQAYQSMVGA